MSWRTLRWKRFMQEHDYFIPSIDGIIMLVAACVLLVAGAILATLLAGMWGHGPIADWLHKRPTPTVTVTIVPR